MRWVSKARFPAESGRNGFCRAHRQVRI